MPRPSMVTRTIKTTKVNTLCASVSKRDTFEQEVTVPRTYVKESDLHKAVTKAITNPDTKLVAILSATVEETLYGLSEQDFIANAKPVSRGKKETADTESAN